MDTNEMWKSEPVIEKWDELPRFVAYAGLFCDPPTAESLREAVLRCRAEHAGVDISGWPLRDAP